MVVKWLLQKIDGPIFHRANRHRHITERRNHDCRCVDPAFADSLEHIQATYLGEPDVEYETAGAAAVELLEELDRRCVGFDLQADRFDEPTKRFTAGIVIVDDRYRWNLRNFFHFNPFARRQVA